MASIAVKELQVWRTIVKHARPVRLALPCAGNPRRPHSHSTQGRLIRYGPGTAHTAFLTGNGSRHLILVGGLSDGLLFTEYCRPLAERAVMEGWTCVQPLLGSSLSGWGLSSLDKDAEDLALLAKELEMRQGAEVCLGNTDLACRDDKC